MLLTLRYPALTFMVVWLFRGFPSLRAFSCFQLIATLLLLPVHCTTCSPTAWLCSRFELAGFPPTIAGHPADVKDAAAPLKLLTSLSLRCRGCLRRFFVFSEARVFIIARSVIFVNV